jgi:hypothetical protein
MVKAGRAAISCPLDVKVSATGRRVRSTTYDSHECCPQHWPRAARHAGPKTVKSSDCPPRVLNRNALIVVDRLTRAGVFCVHGPSIALHQ